MNPALFRAEEGNVTKMTLIPDCAGRWWEECPLVFPAKRLVGASEAYENVT